MSSSSSSSSSSSHHLLEWLVVLCALLLFVHSGDAAAAAVQTSNPGVTTAAAPPSKHVNITDFPYHVSVRRGGQHVCSGALVHGSWIITAASCVYDTSVSNVNVLLGCSNLENQPMDGDQHQQALRLNVTKILVRPTFDDYYPLANNIALLKMEDGSRRLIEASKVVRTIFLPSSEDYHLRDGTLLVVSGWRKLKNKDRDAQGYKEQQDSFESQLSVTGAPLVNQRACVSSMPEYEPTVSGKILCAGYSGVEAEQHPRQPQDDETAATTTCQRDLGAPLANHDILVGILVSEDNCGVNSKFPRIYTRISSHLTWIQKMISVI